MLGDLQGDFQGFPGFHAGDERSFIFPDAFAKMLQFLAQGFFLLNGEAVLEDLVVVFFVDVRLLRDIIEGDVRILLEKADLAHDVFRDAARGQIAHAAVFEDQPHAGDIFHGGQDAGADGMDLADRGRNEPQDNVDIVDHQVHDHTDVQRTVREFVQTVAFDEQGIAREMFDRLEGRVEAFDVADLELPFFLSGEVDEFLRLLNGRGDRFLDKNMRAVLEEEPGDLVVQRGGNTDVDRVNFAGQMPVIFVKRDVVMFSELEGTLLLDVAHADQVNLAAHLAVNLQMAGA